jgi:orotidine-5'-phosphate decarboxylase
MSYIARLHRQVKSKGNPVCVGLDPRWESLPADIRGRAERQSPDRFSAWGAAYREFCIRVIDVVAPLVPVVKPQVAFFEQCGPSGMQALREVILHARQQGLIVIADAKRGDIGSTAEGYADAWLAGADPDAAPWGADALTINPYLGADTLEPFVQTSVARQAGLYILVRTSNPGAARFQDIADDRGRLFQHVADVVNELSRRNLEAGGVEASGYGSIGAVVGATYPGELVELRRRMPRVPFLIPGYGAQGGSAADVMSAVDADGLGAVVNSSRGILFAIDREPFRSRLQPAQWEAAVEQATRDMIADLNAATGER